MIVKKIKEEILVSFHTAQLTPEMIFKNFLLRIGIIEQKDDVSLICVMEKNL